MKIIFMGTPDFAVPSLDILVKQGYDVVAVVTATDKMGGRGGKKVLTSAVKRYAVDHDIPVLQPKNLKAPDFVETLRSYHADLQIVVAFRMLPEVVWAMPPHGTYNLHGSLLPRYRGAAPIHWAVINGDKNTGVTTFKLKHEIDTGNILLQRSMPIAETDTTGTVHDQMMQLGAEVVLETVQLIEAGNPAFTPQDESQVSKAPKLYHDTCKIDWDDTVDNIYDKIRGLNPFPTAWTTLDDIELKIYWADRDTTPHQETPGTISSDHKRYLRVAARDGYLYLKDVKLSGKRRMPITDLLNGLKWDAVKMK
jgi:methionyl-tRNA formyltransferase